MMMMRRPSSLRVRAEPRHLPYIYIYILLSIDLDHYKSCRKRGVQKGSDVLPQDKKAKVDEDEARRRAHRSSTIKKPGIAMMHLLL